MAQAQPAAEKAAQGQLNAQKDSSENYNEDQRPKPDLAQRQAPAEGAGHAYLWVPGHGDIEYM